MRARFIGQLAVLGPLLGIGVLMVIALVIVAIAGVLNAKAQRSVADEEAPTPVSLRGTDQTTAAPVNTSLIIEQLNSNTGEPSNTLDIVNWSLYPAGYSFARTFSIGNRDFVLFLPSQSGYAAIHQLLPGGQLGNQVAEYSWESRWSATEFLTLGDSVFLFLHDAYLGLVRTFRMNDNGTVDTGSQNDVTLTDWQDKNLFTLYQHQDRWYVFGLDTWEGDVTIYTVEGTHVDNMQYTRGWTSVDFLKIGDITYQLLYKAAGDPWLAPGAAGDQLGRLVIRSIQPDTTAIDTLHNSSIGGGWSSVQFARFFQSPSGIEHYGIAFYNRDSGTYAVREFSAAGLGNVLSVETLDPGWTDIELFDRDQETLLLALNEEGSDPFDYDEVEVMAQCIHSQLVDATVGYQFGVIQSGQVIYRRAWGASRVTPSQIAMDTRTRLNIGSASKMITSLNILKLADMGEIDLDNPIGNYLDTAKYPPETLDPWVQSFTLVNLLTHTTGQQSSGCSATLVGGLDCTSYYTSPTACTPATCNNVYFNSNIGALRDVVEWFSATTVPDEYVQVTRELWGERIGVDDMSCTGDPNVFNFNPCSGGGCVTYNGLQWTQAQFTDGEGNVNASAGCASGGWYVSSQHLLQFLSALDYGKVLSPEFNDRLLDTTLTDGSGNQTGLGWGTGTAYWTYPSGVRNLYKNGDLPSNNGVGLRSYITRLPESGGAVLILNSGGNGALNTLVQNAYRFATGGLASCPNY